MLRYYGCSARLLETIDWQGVARKGTGFLHAEDVENLVGEEDDDEEEEAMPDCILA